MTPGRDAKNISEPRRGDGGARASALRLGGGVPYAPSGQEPYTATKPAWGEASRQPWHLPAV